MIIGEEAIKKGVVVHDKIKIVRENDEIVNLKIHDDYELNLYQKIEKAYGRTRVIPTLLILLAAKHNGLLEGDLLPHVYETKNDGEALQDANGEVYERKIDIKDFFKEETINYALRCADVHLKWKGTKIMLAILVNLCIGGGWCIKFDMKGIMVSYEENRGLTYRDIWADTFKVTDLGNTYNQCLTKGTQTSVRACEKLLAVQEDAKKYYNMYKDIMNLYNKVHKFGLREI